MSALPPKADIRNHLALGMSKQIRQLGDIGRDPARLIVGEQNGHRVGLASLMTGTPLPVQ